MKKKIIFIVITMYLLCTLSSPFVFGEEETEQAQSSGIVTPQINFEMTENLTDEPIYPSQTQEVDIKVNFKLDMNQLTKWFFFKRRIGRFLLFGLSYILKIKKIPNSNLSISITEQPSWCSAKINITNFEINFDNIYKNKNSSVETTIKLEFMINEDAKALDKGDIKIQADFVGLGGIGATTSLTTIPITVAYVPEIIVETESELKITPLRNTTVPINITNNGNGNSKILISYITPENWTETFDQENFILNANETKQIILTVNPPKEFDNQTINISFINEYASDPLYKGTTITASINFINDGSLKEENGQEVLIVGVIILIIIILLVISFLFLGKRKQ